MPWQRTLIDSDILAIHCALVPGATAGQVLLFGGDEHWVDQTEAFTSTGFRKVRILDVATLELVPSSQFGRPEHAPASDVFCSGHAMLPDGRLFLVGGTSEWGDDGGYHGGHELSFGGHRRCWAFHPRERRWTELASLNRAPGTETGGGRWYPGVITLGDGDVMAFFGHPDRSDTTQHRNVRPERYDLATNTWTLLATPMASAGLEPGEDGVRYLNYPRVHLLSDGSLFFATPMPVLDDRTYHCTRFDPRTGQYTGDPIDPPTAPAGQFDDYSDWYKPSVLLPLLPEENYRARVLFCGEQRAYRIDLGAAAPAWELTGVRQDAAFNRVRTHALAILLPTGSVVVVGGMHNVGAVDDPRTPANENVDEEPTREAEIYDPGIDWTSDMYTAGTGSWATRERAQLNRNYHSAALLMSDGRVLTSGGNIKQQSGNPADVGIRQIEFYEPDYIPQPGQPDERPPITSAPESVTWGQTFEVTTPNAIDIQRVVLLRCGSVTHAWDFDQRYVGLRFQREADRLRVTAPPNGNIAPPGYYTLWIVDAAGRPCPNARFVRVCDQACIAVTDRNLFSADEVGTGATFQNAFYMVLERFLPSELPASAPVATLTFVDSGATVPGVAVRAQGAPKFEIAAQPPDTPQRIVLTFEIRFEDARAFAEVTTAGRGVRLQLSLDHHTCFAPLRLIREPNPFLLDGDPHWLSPDVRVFPLFEGEPLAVVPGIPAVAAAEDATRFIRAVIADFNARADGAGPHPFDALDASATRLEFARSVNARPVYNFAVARVRYRGQTVAAPDVRVFFRLFTTLASGVEFERATRYRRHEAGTDAIALLGVGDLNEVISIPFFAEDRVATAAPSGGSLQAQRDPSNVIRLDARPPDRVERVRYYGCWLDFNQTVPRFPRNVPTDGATPPQLSDGPYGDSVSVQELLRGEHQCLIAEVLTSVGSDLIGEGEGPPQSDKLAQRNLAIARVPNPGTPATRTIQHTFDLKLSIPPFIPG